MKAVIVGCGRVGATLADMFDRGGHEVVVLDVTSAAFDRLPSTFRGSAIRGDGTDEDVLRRAGAEAADVFLALTEGDNRNIMAAQLAAEAFDVGRTIAKINDPVRANAYAHLGIATLCRTNLMTDAVFGFVGLPHEAAPGIYAPARPHHGAGESVAETGSTVDLPRPTITMRPANERDHEDVPPATADPGTPSTTAAAPSGAGDGRQSDSRED
ncbi:MAG: potassium channel family protein [Chloroflexota bacterium]|jgi:trk system potassium uptake protein